ncbi:hypothetical protein K445DRAFT_154939 [Daldinia sp. EC12]|nr:hypothetical protein K445DRAFT_154939 [Daldinia sp. EC12]
MVFSFSWPHLQDLSAGDKGAPGTNFRMSMAIACVVFFFFFFFFFLSCRGFENLVILFSACKSYAVIPDEEAPSNRKK